MLFSKLVCAAALSTVVLAQNKKGGNGGGNKGGNADAAAAAGGDGATGTTLLANAIQSGSFVDGSQQIGANEANQVKSATSKNNFINNCSGKQLTNGLQITAGSCNGIPMGDIPSKANMISSIIIFPPVSDKAVVDADTTFNITVAVSNLVAGQFTNADATYYGAPQALQGGKILGHTHVTVQDMGKSLNPTTPVDPTQFAFFKGINDAGNGKGLLSAIVTGGLPAGNYRVCTLTSSSNHQPVLMPVAQRGSSDDCQKFTVGGKGNVANNAANSGSGGVAAAALAQSAVDAGPGAIDTATVSSAAAVDTAKAGGAKGGKGASSAAAAASTDVAKAGNGKGGKGGKGAASAAAAAPANTETAKAGGAKGGKGGKGAASAAAAAPASTEAAKAGNGGKGAKGGAAGAAAAPAGTEAAKAGADKGAKGGNGGGRGGRKERRHRRSFIV